MGAEAAATAVRARAWAGALLLAGLAVAGLAALRDDFAERGSTLAQLLPPAEVQRMETATASLARQEESALVVLEGPPWSGARVDALRRSLAEAPGVLDARELPRFGRAAPEAGPRLLVLALAPGASQLAAARRLAAELDARLAAARLPGERATWIGWPRMRAESWALARADLVRLLPLLVVAALAVPWLFLGSPGAGVFALLVAALTTALALWGYRLAAGPLGPLALLLVPFLWAVATTDALHLAARARALAGRGLPASACVRRARAELAAPCLVTSLTTAVSLGVLGVAGHAGLLRELGLTAAAGTMAAWLVTFGPGAPLAALALPGPPPPRWPGALALAAIRAARRAPRRALAVWGGVALLALAGLPGLRVASAFPNAFAPGTRVARDLVHLTGTLGADLAPLDVAVVASDPDGRRPTAVLNAVLALWHALRSWPEVRAVLPLDALDAADLARTAPHARPDERDAAVAALLAREELAPWVAPAEGRALLQVHLRPADDAERSELVARLEHFDATMLGHHALELAGPAWAMHRAEQLGLVDLRTGTGLSLLALAGLLAAALRRPRAWIGALVASMLPLVLVAGAMGWLGVGWSVALLPLPIVLLGMSVDDSVHLLWRSPRRGRHPQLAAILATTALVATCVATLAWTSFRTNREFGLLLAAGLAAALAADLTLLPVLVRSPARRAPRSAR